MHAAQNFMCFRSVFFAVGQRRWIATSNLRVGCLQLAMVIGLYGQFTAVSQAQVVQLPSYRSFSYSGSAWVPDGGTVALGGVNTARYGSSVSGFGPLSRSGIGGGSSSQTLSASAQIIDLDAMDEAILAGGVALTASRPGLGYAGNQLALETATDNSGTKKVANRSALGDPMATGRRSVQLIDQHSQRVGADPGEWQRVLAGGSASGYQLPSAVEADIRYYLEQGHAAEKANRHIAASVYYKMAREAMPPELLEQYHLKLRERMASEDAKENVANSAIGGKRF